MKIIIVGAGGHGRVVLDILVQARSHEIVGFVDSNAALTGRQIDGVQVLGTLEALPELQRSHGVAGAVVGIGDNVVRVDFAARIAALGLSLENAVHPSANLARTAEIGRNVVIAAGAMLCAHCRVRDSVILNTGCIVDHESLIAEGVHIAPGARLAGRVTVEPRAFVGIGSTIIQNVRIGCEAVVGAGAVVIASVPDATTVVGVPARPIRRSSAGS